MQWQQPTQVDEEIAVDMAICFAQGFGTKSFK
jgi:hypothetical protein